MNATATLLQDGRVLVAGGGPDAASALSSAETYDPATRKFTRTGSMATARSDASATLLQDGRVLIAGGFGCGNTKTCSDYQAMTLGRDLASAELYDPTTGEFTRTGSMSDSRQGPTATLLPDGRVLLLNGGSKLAELYDPTSGKFTSAGSLLGEYTTATATLLPNGKVLVVHDGDANPGAELFDPASGKSTPIPLLLPPDALSPPNGRTPTTATLIKDGHVVVSVFGTSVDYLLIYDPETNSFAQALPIPSAPREWWMGTATLLPDGRTLFAGGVTYDSLSAESAALYDPVNGFQMILPMIAGRLSHTATLLLDGTVLIAGGISGDQVALSSAELFKP
jgi:hypothetical protein